MTETNPIHEMNLLDQEFAKAWKPNAENKNHFSKALTTWDKEAKISFIIAVKYRAKKFIPAIVKPDSFDVCIYFVKTHRELASYFVEHDVLGSMPFVMKAYIDFDRFSRDLSCEYTKTEIAGETVIFSFTEEALS